METKSRSDEPPKPLTKEVRFGILHSLPIREGDLAGMTFTKRHSEYPGASSDYQIMKDGVKVYEGRSFPGAPYATFWVPTKTFAYRE